MTATELTLTSGGYYYRFELVRISGRNSMVECQLPKLEVVGSSPIARSKIRFPLTDVAPQHLVPLIL